MENNISILLGQINKIRYAHLLRKFFAHLLDYLFCFVAAKFLSVLFIAGAKSFLMKINAYDYFSMLNTIQITNKSILPVTLMSYLFTCHYFLKQQTIGMKIINLKEVMLFSHLNLEVMLLQTNNKWTKRNLILHSIQKRKL